VNVELLVAMLEKHGIQPRRTSTIRPADDGDLSRLARVFVPEADYDRAHRLFYSSGG